MNRLTKNLTTAITSHSSCLKPKLANPLIILPTYNEAKNITKILEAIEALPCKTSILVVDDSSPDDTAKLVTNYPSFKKNVFLLKRPRKSGLGSAYRDGFQWGLENGHDVYLQMDSDFSHNPNDIPRLIDAINDGADVAIGSRYVNGISVINWPIHRLLLSIFAGFYTRLITGIPMFDPTAGFKAIRPNVIKKIGSKVNTEGYAFQIETHFFAWRNGFAIKEIPIIFTERRNGQSKLSLAIKIESIIRVLQLGLKRLW